MHVGKRVAEFAIAAAVVAAAGATTVLVYRGSGHDPAVLSFWAFTAVVLLWGLLSHVADSGRYRKLPVAPGRVLAIIPAYNETTGALHATVEAVLRQTIACDIIVVDDGSVNPLDAFRNPRVRWVRQPNGGKRAAQVTALYATERGDYEFILTVDSDSEPYPDALEQLLRAMSDPQVWAATGWVHTRNYTDNWVARCADLDIGTALVMNRSSRTQLGALETVSGALSVYRAELLWDESERYLADGEGAGDDHWLTSRAVLRGKVVGVKDALVDTDMPTQVRRTYQQRERWCRSTYLMARFSITQYRWVRLLPVLVDFVYLVTAPLCLTATVVAVGYSAARGQDFVGISLADVAAFLTLAVIAKLGLSGLYLLRRPRMSVGQKLLSMLAAATILFIFGVFAVTLPRYGSLLRLRRVAWATRELKGVVPLPPQPRRSAEHVPRRARTTGAIPPSVIRDAVQARTAVPAPRRRRDLNSTAVLDFVEIQGRLKNPTDKRQSPP